MTNNLPTSPCLRKYWMTPLLTFDELIRYVKLIFEIPRGNLKKLKIIYFWPQFNIGKQGAIQYLRKQREVGRWSVKCLLYKVNTLFYLLCLFTRGRWVVKKVQNSVYVIIEWPLSSLIIFIFDFRSSQKASHNYKHKKVGRSRSHHPHISDASNMVSTVPEGGQIIMGIPASNFAEKPVLRKHHSFPYEMFNNETSYSSDDSLRN